MLRDILRKFVLSVITDDPIQVTLAVAIDDISGRHFLSLIHPHIQWGILPVSETAFRVIQLIG